MTEIVNFPTADRRQQIKEEKYNRKGAIDFMMEMAEQGYDIQSPRNLADLVKMLMTQSKQAKDDGNLVTSQHLDDVAWDVRSRHDGVTELLYREGFLQEHGII